MTFGGTVRRSAAGGGIREAVVSKDISTRGDQASGNWTRVFAQLNGANFWASRCLLQPEEMSELRHSWSG